MATIKSFTSLEQSKILAKILPLESADMHYATWAILDGEFIVSPNQGSTIKSLQEDYGNQIIPCWSLAALLSILPKEVRLVGSTKDHYWYCECIDAHDSNWYAGFESSDNPVDACYEMIVKLHEQNLL